MIVSIHQPNFFPWLGYFDKILRSDVFVFLDDVAYPKSGSSMSCWTNRCSISSGGIGKTWIRCPVVRQSGTQLISEVQINSTVNWRLDIVDSLTIRYQKYPFFQETMEIVQRLLQIETTSLSLFNQSCIKSICTILKIKPNIVIQSDSLPKFESTSTELLADIVSSLGGNEYLYGGGASQYQDNQLFLSRGISPIAQNFLHPEYHQTGSGMFEPGLSTLDALFSIGIEGTMNLLHGK